MALRTGLPVSTQRARSASVRPFTAAKEVAICVAFLGVFATMWALPGRPAGVVGAMLCWGLIGFAFYSAQQLRLVMVAPTRAPVMFALNSTMLYFGTAAGAAIGGAVIAAVGYRGLPVAAAGLIGVAALLVRGSEAPRGTPAAGS